MHEENWISLFVLAHFKFDNSTKESAVTCLYKVKLYFPSNTPSNLFSYD